MLTDIFAERYVKRRLWPQFTEEEAKLLVRCFRIVSEQVQPYWNSDGKPIEAAKNVWETAHDRLSMELGVDDLSPRYWFTAQQAAIAYTIEQACKNFVTAAYTPGVPADRFIKERLSFIELMFRLRGEDIAAQRASLPSRTAAATLEDSLRHHRLRLPGSIEDGLKAQMEEIERRFKEAVGELNERFRRGGVPLNYHNGFIQITGDEVVESQIEEPFWKLASDPKWKNVDLDMKEAIDRRDNGDRDSALYAAKALESTLKIISDQKGWTRGDEKGATAYVNNLRASKNGGFIAEWEKDALSSFFRDIRNPLGHGPGGQPMPELSASQTNWAVETCMSWIRSLITRL